MSSTIDLKNTNFTDYVNIHKQKIHVFLDNITKTEARKHKLSKCYIPKLPDSYRDIAKDGIIIVIGQILQRDLKSNALLIPNHFVMRSESAIRVYNGIKTKFDIDIPIICSGGEHLDCGFTESEILYSLLRGNLYDIFKRQKSDLIVNKNDQDLFLIQENLLLNEKRLKGVNNYIEESKRIFIEKESCITELNLSNQDIFNEKYESFDFEPLVESARKTKKFLKKLVDKNQIKQPKNLIIVTNHYHLPRAKFIFDYVFNQEDLGKIINLFKLDIPYDFHEEHGMCDGREFGEHNDKAFNIIEPPYITQDPTTESKIKEVCGKSFDQYMVIFNFVINI